MTTPTNPAAPLPTGDHWRELAETLPPERTDEFSKWMEGELETLEEELAVFVTVNSLRRSLRRR